MNFKHQENNQNTKSPKGLKGYLPGDVMPDGSIFEGVGDNMGEGGENVPMEDQKAPEKKMTQAQVIFELACKHCDFFHTPDNISYASIDMGDHQENWPIRKKNYRLLLSRLYREKTGKMPGSQAIQDALRELEGIALFDGPEYEIHYRFAGKDDTIYIDLGNHKWEQIKITKGVWSVITAKESPVKFKRTKNMKAMPYPVKGGSLNSLRKFLNIHNQHEWVLLVSWIIGAMRPQGPFSILILQGEQDTAKSTTSKLLCDLIDPSTLKSRTLPKSERDLAISASNSWVNLFDNISRIVSWLIDALCRLSTGGGFETRALFTDDSTISFDVTRPIILNGISDLATQPDLADRSLIVRFDPISDEKRKSERIFWKEWEREKPGILGAFCDVISEALRNLGKVEHKSLPRMADFSEWVMAAEPALPWEKGTFIKEYQLSRKNLVDTALDADPIWPVVVEFVEKHPDWSGTPAELAEAFKKIADPNTQRRMVWPKGPSALSSKLRQLGPALKKNGIDIKRGKSGQRNITIRKMVHKAVQPDQKNLSELNKVDAVDDVDGSFENYSKSSTPPKVIYLEGPRDRGEM